MKERRYSDWVMPSIADILFLSFFFKLLSNGDNLLNDGDTGWHIVTGESILRTFKIPFADPYSHTAPGMPWTTHEWLAEVIFGLFHRQMGLNGVVLVSSAVISLTFFFLYLFMLHRKINAIVAVSFTILGAFASSLHWLARPHIFSLAFTLAFVVILEMYQRVKVNHLKLLPLLMMVWVNLHGGYILGLILVLFYAFGNLLSFISGRERNDASKRACKALGVAAVFTLLATFVNPHGPSILLFPFHLIGREFIMNNVVEWLSPDFHQYRLFELMLLLFITTLTLSRRKPDLIEGSVALLLTSMSLYSVRYIPLFAIVVTPMVAARGEGVVNYLAGKLSSIRFVVAARGVFSGISENVIALEGRFRRHLWIYAAIGACTLITLNGGRLGKAQIMAYKHDKAKFPVDAVDFALSNQITGNMFNNDRWVGYIIYRSYPEYKVFQDGRSDMYGVFLLEEYMKVAGAHLDYEDVVDKYGVTWVIFNANSPICQILAASGKWKLVYADTTANILLKDIPENGALIEKYKGVMFVAEDEKN